MRFAGSLPIGSQTVANVRRIEMAQPQIRDDIGAQYDVARIRADYPILSEEVSLNETIKSRSPS